MRRRSTYCHDNVQCCLSRNEQSRLMQGASNPRLCALRVCSDEDGRTRCLQVASQSDCKTATGSDHVLRPKSTGWLERWCTEEEGGHPRRALYKASHRVASSRRWDEEEAPTSSRAACAYLTATSPASCALVPSTTVIAIIATGDRGTYCPRPWSHPRDARLSRRWELHQYSRGAAAAERYTTLRRPSCIAQYVIQRTYFGARSHCCA